MIEARQDNFVCICKRCHGKCCREAKPPLTRSRTERVSRYLGEEEHSFQRRTQHYSHPEELPNGYCILFDPASGLCKVHPVKPETCVAGPITFDVNMREGKIEWYLKTEKICQLAGEMARDTRSLSKHLETARREILKLVDELEGSELHAILEIEEEETFKIGEDQLPIRVLKRLFASSR